MEIKSNHRFKGVFGEVGDTVRAVTLAVNVGLLTFAAVYLMVSFNLMLSFI